MTVTGEPGLWWRPKARRVVGDVVATPDDVEGEIQCYDGQGAPRRPVGRRLIDHVYPSGFHLWSHHVIGHNPMPGHTGRIVSWEIDQTAPPAIVWTRCRCYALAATARSHSSHVEVRPKLKELPAYNN